MTRTAAEAVQVDIGGEQLSCYIEDGQVRVRLPFQVDQPRLTELLRNDHYPVASAPGQTDSQGWGHTLDPDDYYPYWVYPDPDPDAGSRFIFAFPPADYKQADDGSHQPFIGPEAKRIISRWYDLLKSAATDARH